MSFEKYRWSNAPRKKKKVNSEEVPPKGVAGGSPSQDIPPKEELAKENEIKEETEEEKTEEVRPQKWWMTRKKLIENQLGY